MLKKASGFYIHFNTPSFTHLLWSPEVLKSVEQWRGQEAADRIGIIPSYRMILAGLGMPKLVELAIRAVQFWILIVLHIPHYYSVYRYSTDTYDHKLTRFCLKTRKFRQRSANSSGGKGSTLRGEDAWKRRKTMDAWRKALR